MNEGMIRTHHILILLSGGEHNQGPPHNHVFPKLREMLVEDVKFSVVVVGYFRYSITSMGMLLKKSIETVTFDSMSV